jgi:DNA-binding response OmpR family regulator
VAKARILLIEDDDVTALWLMRVLQEAGYEVALAQDGYRGLAQALIETFDAIILDWMLPDMDGLDMCRRLRQEKDLPIILLTSRSTVEDRVTGLYAGADDYLIKPVAPEELIARITVRLRRRQPVVPPASVLRYASLELLPQQRRGLLEGRELRLSPTEFKLLFLFLQSAEIVLTRDQLMNTVWGPDFEGDSNVLEAYVRILRKKLEANGEPRLLHTVRSVGYVLRESVPGG